ncbi:MAG: translation initiation factor IF-3, partial [Burkholderiaceae bacterium]
MATEKLHRVNSEITSLEIRLVGVDNQAIGIVKLAEALRLAEEEGVDLVEIAPQADPVVCKLM